MRKRRDRAQRLRTAVEVLPEHTRTAMLRGIDANEIIVGAYTDRDGGVCPMLAAHRNGGRTSFASFALAWDDFTGAKRRISRRATRREVAVLRSYLEMSLLADETRGESISGLADQIRSERRAVAERAAAAEPQPIPPSGESAGAPQIRIRRLWPRKRHRSETPAWPGRQASAP